MTRYSRRVSDIRDYDLVLLTQEVITAGLPVENIYAGTGLLLFEFPGALTDQEKTTLQDVIIAHAPILFTWTENGVTRSEQVHCAEDVDRITARRVRAFIGGIEPIQEQLKQLRLSLWAHETRIKVLEGATVSSADQTAASNLTSLMLLTHSLIEGIRTEG